MEQLIKQASRVRFVGQQSTEASGSTSGREVPLKKSPSFKEEKKRIQNWFRRESSGQMNQSYDSNEIERATAVAAAAYAIASLKESTTSEQKKIGPSTGPYLNRIKSRKEHKRIFSGTESGEDAKGSQEIQESEELQNAATEEKSPAKVVGPASSMKTTPTFTDKPAVPKMKKTPTFSDKPTIPMKKIPTFAEEQLSKNKEIQTQSPMQKTDLPATEPEMEIPKPDWRTSPTKPAISPPKLDRQTSTKPGVGGTEADAWERAKLAKIKKKYEELEARIQSWENKKKAKSRHRLDKIEGGIEKKRLKGLEQFRSEVEDINQIAEGARSKAMKGQQNEEIKAKEKANKFRKTGKVPRTCLCF